MTEDSDAIAQAILDCLFRSTRPVTAGNICYRTGLKHTELYPTLAQLVDEGKVEPRTEPEATAGREYRRTFYALT